MILPNYMGILIRQYKDQPILVGGWTNPFEKYARQIGSLISPGRDEHWKNIWNHHLVVITRLRPSFRGSSSLTDCWWFRNPANHLRCKKHPGANGWDKLPTSSGGFLPSTGCKWYSTVCLIAQFIYLFLYHIFRKKRIISCMERVLL